MPINPSLPIIQFDHVTVSAADKDILTDLSFSLSYGQKAVVCGKSGVGKSTVLKTVLGLQERFSGKIFFQGLALNPANIAVIRSRIAYVAQEPVMAADTVRQALLLPFSFISQRSNEPNELQILSVLERLQLNPSILTQTCNRISGGEKQRLALARALLMGKQVFLLDEVTSALDSDSKQAVFQVLLNPEFTVLSVAHDQDWITHCDQVYQLSAGQILKAAA